MSKVGNLKRTKYARFAAKLERAALHFFFLLRIHWLPCIQEWLIRVNLLDLGNVCLSQRSMLTEGGQLAMSRAHQYYASIVIIHKPKRIELDSVRFGCCTKFIANKVLRMFLIRAVHEEQNTPNRHVSLCFHPACYTSSLKLISVLQTTILDDIDYANRRKNLLIPVWWCEYFLKCNETN